jgi:hypothetical protein
VQENCIPVSFSELSGLDILWQRKFKDHFEVTVMYQQYAAICPQCGVITTKVQDRRRQRRKQEVERQSGIPNADYEKISLPLL